MPFNTYFISNIFFFFRLNRLISDLQIREERQLPQRKRGGSRGFGLLKSTYISVFIKLYWRILAKYGYGWLDLYSCPRVKALSYFMDELAPAILLPHSILFPLETSSRFSFPKSITNINFHLCSKNFIFA